MLFLGCQINKKSLVLGDAYLLREVTLCGHRFLHPQVFWLSEALHLDFFNQDRISAKLTHATGCVHASASVSAKRSIFARGSTFASASGIQFCFRQHFCIRQGLNLEKKNLSPVLLPIALFASGRDETQNLNLVQFCFRQQICIRQRNQVKKIKNI